MKKIISIFLAVFILLANSATISVQATATDAVATISSCSGSQGATVEVFFAIDAPLGIKTLSFYNFVYDSSVLELVDDENNPDDCVWLVDGKIEDIDIANSASVITFADNTSYSGNILKLSFIVSDNAKAGEYPISCSVVATRMVDGIETKINVDLTAGKITIEGNVTPLCDFDYEIIDGGIRILSYIGNKSDVVIDNSYEIDGKMHNVVEISEFAFENNEDILTVTIPSTVISIGDYAFYGCTSLHSVTVYSSDALISEKSFGYYYISKREDGVVEDLTLYGYAGSTVEEYVSLNPGIKFAEITDIVFEPVGTTVFEKKNGINYIYGLKPKLEISLFETDYVTYANVMLEYQATVSNCLVTDSVVVVKSLKTSEVISEYKVIIFGDVNGDGWYDGEDAFLVNLIAKGMLDKDDVGEAIWSAADCNHDGVIDEWDVDLLTGAGLLLNKVDQSETTAELALNSDYIEYAMLIDQSAGMTPGIMPDADYTQQGATDTNTTPELPADKTNIEVMFTSIFDLITKLLNFIFSFAIK